MTFPNVWREIREALKDMALETPMARGIMRKAGYVAGSSSGSSAAPILSLYGSRRVCFTPAFVRSTDQTNWAVLRDGLYVWGSNAAGQMSLPEGNPTVLWALEPTRHAPEVSGVIDVAGTAASTSVLKSDGTVLIGGTLDQSQPTPAFHSTALTGITQLAAHRKDFTGDAHYYLKNDGTVWGMGSFMAGMGTIADPYIVPYAWTEDVWTPSQMPTDKVSDVVEISAQFTGLLFRKSDDTVGFWANQTEFPVMTSAPASPITKMRGGFAHTLILTDDGDIYATGNNSFGQFGNGTFTSDLSRSAWHQATGTGYTDVDGAELASIAVSGSQLYTWGIGDPISARGPSAVTTHTPTAITDMDDVVSVVGNNVTSVAFAIKEDGCIWVWGTNLRGQLGRGYLGGESSVPVQVLFSEAYPAYSTVP